MHLTNHIIGTYAGPNMLGSSCTGSDSSSATSAMQIMLVSEDGRTLYRRDPYARQTDYASNWCYAVDPSAYEWKNTDWQQLEHDRYIIYEMQVGATAGIGMYYGEPHAQQQRMLELAGAEPPATAALLRRTCPTIMARGTPGFAGRWLLLSSPLSTHPFHNRNPQLIDNTLQPDAPIRPPPCTCCPAGRLLHPRGQLCSCAEEAEAPGQPGHHCSAADAHRGAL